MTATSFARGAPPRCSDPRTAAPSSLGTFLRSFTFGHVRQLDRVLGASIERAWLAWISDASGSTIACSTNMVAVGWEEVVDRAMDLALGGSPPSPPHNAR